jgi:hypothetical protein
MAFNPKPLRDTPLFAVLAAGIQGVSRKLNSLGDKIIGLDRMEQL